MIYLYLFGTCFHFIYVFMIIGKYIFLTGRSNVPLIVSKVSKAGIMTCAFVMSS